MKRAGLALIASLALHTKGGPDAPFLRALKVVEREAADERNFVKKGVSWALRAIGGKKSLALKAAPRGCGAARRVDKCGRTLGRQGRAQGVREAVRRELSAD